MRLFDKSDMTSAVKNVKKITTKGLVTLLHFAHEHPALVELMLFAVAATVANASTTYLPGNVANRVPGRVLNPSETPIGETLSYCVVDIVGHINCQRR